MLGMSPESLEIVQMYGKTSRTCKLETAWLARKQNGARPNHIICCFVAIPPEAQPPPPSRSRARGYSSRFPLTTIRHLITCCTHVAANISTQTRSILVPLQKLKVAASCAFLPAAALYRSPTCVAPANPHHRTACYIHIPGSIEKLCQTSILLTFFSSIF